VRDISSSPHTLTLNVISALAVRVEALTLIGTVIGFELKTTIFAELGLSSPVIVTAGVLSLLPPPELGGVISVNSRPVTGQLLEVDTNFERKSVKAISYVASFPHFRLTIRSLGGTGTLRVCKRQGVTSRVTGIPTASCPCYGTSDKVKVILLATDVSVTLTAKQSSVVTQSVERVLPGSGNCKY
jgi:hypothetical protein